MKPVSNLANLLDQKKTVFSVTLSESLWPFAHVVCWGQVNRAQNTGHTEVCLLYNQNNKILSNMANTLVWEIHEVH